MSGFNSKKRYCIVFELSAGRTGGKRKAAKTIRRHYLPFNQTYRLSTATTDADRDALSALKVLRGYAPNNPNHSPEALAALQEAMGNADEAELRAQRALAAARDAAIAAGWEFHNAILGAKSQVIGQFGSDSTAVQSLGLKKKSERKRAARRSGSASAG
jgi:hypothetical protein